MREVVYAMIAGNPYIKKEHKPTSKRDIIKLSMDEERKKVEGKKLSPAELENIKKDLLKRLNKEK